VAEMPDFCARPDLDILVNVTRFVDKIISQGRASSSRSVKIVKKQGEWYAALLKTTPFYRRL
jgi:hypothetical protein